MYCNFAAQLLLHYPTPDLKSLCQELSEYMLGFFGTEFFTRLDVREQCTLKCTFISLTVLSIELVVYAKITTFWALLLAILSIFS